MSKEKREVGSVPSMEELLQAGARAEQQLLKQERQAENKLGRALAAMERDQARLAKAQQRLERSRGAVNAATATLHDAQAHRAGGPEVSR